MTAASSRAAAAGGGRSAAPGTAGRARGQGELTIAAARWLRRHRVQALAQQDQQHGTHRASRRRRLCSPAWTVTACQTGRRRPRPSTRPRARRSAAACGSAVPPPRAEPRPAAGSRWPAAGPRRSRSGPAAVTTARAPRSSRRTTLVALITSRRSPASYSSSAGHADAGPASRTDQGRPSPPGEHAVWPARVASPARRSASCHAPSVAVGVRPPAFRPALAWSVARESGSRVVLAAPRVRVRGAYRAAAPAAYGVCMATMAAGRRGRRLARAPVRAVAAIARDSTFVDRGDPGPPGRARRAARAVDRASRPVTARGCCSAPRWPRSRWSWPCARR